jgi:hypothetical protein
LTEKKDAAPKAMSATERKMVKEIIDGDFDRLRREVDMHCAELARRKSVEFTERWAGLQEACRQAERDWQQLQADIRTRVNAFLDRKRDEGLRISVRYNDPPVSFGREVVFTSIARENAETEFNNQMERAKMIARNALDNQRSQIQREIVLTGIVSGQAKDFIDSQPDPREVMVKALGGNPDLAQIFNLQVVEGQVTRPAVEATPEQPPVEVVTGADAVPNLDVD